MAALGRRPHRGGFGGGARGPLVSAPTSLPPHPPPPPPHPTPPIPSQAWYPGELGGDAIISSLLGNSNRFGALPVTMYSDAFSRRDLYTPTSAQLQFDGGVTHGWYTNQYGAPTFAFGFQGSYTSFNFSWASGAPPAGEARFDAAAVAAPSSPLISYHVNVTNTGAVAGDAIALLLVGGAPPDYPLERLIGFERVSLAPGETASINFDASAHALSRVREDGSRWLTPGTALTVALGGRAGGAAGEPLRHAITLAGEAEVKRPVFAAPEGREPRYELRRGRA